MLAGTGTTRPTNLDELLGRELLSRLDRLDVLSRKVFAGKLPGERRSKRRGQSVEFDDYRNYVAGDDLRHIDWNVFARLDRFFLKLFREEEDLSLHIVIDASASMDAGDPNKLIFAQQLAVAIGYIGLVNQNRVAPAIVGVTGRPGVQQLAPMRGRKNIQRLARFVLDNVVPASGVNRVGGGALPASIGLVDSMRQIAMTRRGKGVMIFLSDFLTAEPIAPGLNYLASGVGGSAGSSGGGGFDTYCLQILAPGEIEPQTEAERGIVGDLRLTDIETGKGAEVTMSAALIKRYKQRLADHIQGLETACAARGMTYAMLRSDSELEPLLLDYLRKRGLLG